MTMRVSDSNRGVAVIVAVVVLGLVTAGATVGLPAVAELQEPSGDEVLDNVDDRYDDADTVTASADVTVSNDSETTEATVDSAFAEPDKFRFVVEAEDSTYETGSDGEVLWAVGEEEAFAREIPSDREHEEYASDMEHEGYEHPGEFAPDEDVEAELVETTDIDGEEAYVVELTPTDDADEKYEAVESTLWVSTDDYRILQMSVTDGDTETTVEVTDQAFDESIHDSTFEPPEDRVEVTETETFDEFDELEESTDLDVPEYDDGEFEEASSYSSADGEAVVQEYATEDRPVSIVTATGASNYLDDMENGTSVTVDGGEATAVEREDKTTVFWTDDGTTTGVIVEGDVDEAVDIAEEIR